MSATITIQAADGPKENDILLKHAALTPLVAGVVGWVPLDKPDKAARMLEQFSREQKFVGVRLLINAEPDQDWIMRSAVIDGLSVLMDSNLTFDYVGILPRHLAHVPILAERLPALRIRGGYGKVWREINAATSQLGPQERARIFGRTAIEVYRLVL